MSFCNTNVLRPIPIFEVFYEYNNTKASSYCEGLTVWRDKTNITIKKKKAEVKLHEASYRKSPNNPVKRAESKFTDLSIYQTRGILI